MILSVILFLLFFLLGLRHLYVYKQERRKVAAHIYEVAASDLKKGRGKRTLLAWMIRKFSEHADDYAGLGRRINFFSEDDEIEKLLYKAGNPYDLTVSQFQGTKMALTVAGFGTGVLGLVLGLPLAQFGLFVLPLAGYFGTIFSLRIAAKARQDELAYDLPDFLDTVSVSLQAGVGLDQALRGILQHFHGPLQEEFTRFLYEVDLGIEREAAYRSLLARNDSPEFLAFIKALIQGQKLGVPISTTFKIQAEDMRRIRFEKVKEKAAKASPKVTLITTLIVTPTAMIMIAGLVILNLLYGDNAVLDIFK